MPFNEKNIFLLDGIGALMSAVFTGLLLPLVSDRIGMPIWILRSLALLPLGYAFYSFSCYRFPERTKPWMLSGIMGANVFYCFLSGALIFRIDSLTDWGKTLLLGEILVVIAVVAIEWTVYRKAFR